MNTRTPQNTMPTVQLCLSRNTKEGGRHGCRLGIGLDGPLSTAGAGFYAADFHHVSSHRHRMDTLPLQADSHESGLHHRIVAFGSCGPALDGVRKVFLPRSLVAAGSLPLVVDSHR